MTGDVKKSLSLLSLSYTLALVNSARILAIFPAPSISHQVVFRPLTQELVRRGHEVIVITTDPAYSKGGAPLNLTEIDVHDLSYQIWTDVLFAEDAFRKSDVLPQVHIVLKLMVKIFESQLSLEEVQRIINKKHGKFDLLLLEAFFQPLLVFTHLYKVPTIQISSMPGLQFNYEVFGVSTHSFLYPVQPQRKLYNLSNLEKLEQLYYRWRLNRIYEEVELEGNKLLQNAFGADIPSIRELSRNVDMLFLNTNPIWTDNQPVPQSVVHIGGIHNTLATELPKDLQTFLNASKNGVIYFSLGTNVIPSLMPPNKIQTMIKVFSQLPYDIIWKWDKDSMPGKSDNIKLYKWLPQSSLLKHPKIKLFITQGGLQSIDEAIDACVPLIGIPIILDQWFNAEKLEYHKIGVKLVLSSLTEEVFKRSIEKVITDNRYKENINRLKTIVKDEPQSPLERAIWWTEYVLRHGGAKHLRAAGANISWAQYLELELVAVVSSVLFSFILLVLLTLYFIIKLIATIKPTSKTKKS